MDRGELVPCACGCGTLHHERDRRGRPRRFIAGHNQRDPDKPIAVRFWGKVDRSGDCWPWEGHRDKYGKFTWKEHGRDRSMNAHVLAWVLTHGPVPPGKQVLHECDNPPCCRPEPGHLYLGDHSQNMADRGNRKRQAKGERQGAAKLTEAQVREIRRRAAAGEALAALAREFDVSDTNVGYIIHRKSWAWLNDDEENQ